jgi:hypothetical protein
MIKNLTTVVHQNVLLFYEIGMEVLAFKVLYNNNFIVFNTFKKCIATGGSNNYTFIVEEIGDLWSNCGKWVAVIQSIQCLYPHYFLKYILKWTYLN